MLMWNCYADILKATGDSCFGIRCANAGWKHPLNDVFLSFFSQKTLFFSFAYPFFFLSLQTATVNRGRLLYHQFRDVTGNQCKNENEKQTAKPPKKHGMTTCDVPLVLSARQMPLSINVYVRKGRSMLVSHACNLQS